MGLLSLLVGSILALYSQHPLAIVSNEVSGAQVEVWSDNWCPTASIMAPRGRDLGDFLDAWRGWSVDVDFSCPNPEIKSHRYLWI